MGDDDATLAMQELMSELMTMRCGRLGWEMTMRAMGDDNAKGICGDATRDQDAT